MRLFNCILILLFAINIASGQSILITEIFADPTPSKGLPEREFLEIYNSSNKAISLKGHKLIYGKTIALLPDSILGSGEYAILCRSTYINEFSNYGLVIGLPNLSLNNTGETLRLLNSKDEELQYIPYSKDWYTAGMTEGYSLEMIDLDYPCVGKNNWASSNSKLGATPGKPNSINSDNPDILAPVLKEYNMSENQILLVFDEILSKSFIEEINNFEILEGDCELVSVDFWNNQRHIVSVLLNTQEENNLVLRVYNATDCSGNTTEDMTVSFLNLPEPNIGDIQISEILFNPKVGGEDFVELYNNSNQAFNIKNWGISNKNSDGTLGKITLLTAFDKVLEPNMYLAFTTNKSHLLANYPFTGNIIELSNFPAYNNDKGTVVLIQPDSTIFDEFTYNEAMHSYLINNPDGVSLEKVSFRRNQNSWATASTDVGYATPGTKNSQEENDLLEQNFYADPILFDPSSNSSNTETSLKYNLSSNGNYASIYIVDKTGRKVKNIGSNLLLGTQGVIPWDGRDDSGKILPIGYYVFIIKVFNKGFEQSYYAKTVLAAK